MKHQVRGIIQVDRSEDSGAAIICEPLELKTDNSSEDHGVSVKLTSWDEDKDHIDIKEMIGKRVLITIETQD